MREHGTRACYVGNGCRCDDCRRANREYEARRVRLALYGQWEPYVDASRAREHVLLLRELGVGWKEVARISGVSNGSVSRLLYGHKERPPSRRIRRETEQAILLVTWRDRAGGVRVPAAETWQLIEVLLRAGYPKVRIAEAIGQSRALQLSHHQVSLRHAQIIEHLYERLFRDDPCVRLAASVTTSPRRIRHRWLRQEVAS